MKKVKLFNFHSCYTFTVKMFLIKKSANRPLRKGAFIRLLLYNREGRLLYDSEFTGASVNQLEGGRLLDHLR